ncbi:MAG: hypothetical protein LBV30_08720 [Propionibacteriaceae bacterium]|nr:hypothetical protein [Propionibacteriaceae bacterium]
MIALQTADGRTSCPAIRTTRPVALSLVEDLLITHREELSNMPENYDCPIATRELWSGSKKYRLELMKPRSPEKGLVTCSWRLIDDSGSVVVALDVAGADTLDALINTIVIVRQRIAAEALDLRWESLEGPGLPRLVDPQHQPGVIDTYADLPAGWWEGSGTEVGRGR